MTRAGIGGRFYPNGLSAEDTTNNVERVRIDQPDNGARYTIHVAGTRLIDKQEYSLVVTGCIQQDKGGSAPATSSPTRSPVQSNDGSTTCTDTSKSFAVTGSQNQGKHKPNHHFFRLFFQIELTLSRRLLLVESQFEFLSLLVQLLGCGPRLSLNLPGVQPDSVDFETDFQSGGTSDGQPTLVWSSVRH